MTTTAAPRGRTGAPTMSKWAVGFAILTLVAACLPPFVVAAIPLFLVTVGLSVGGISQSRARGVPASLAWTALALALAAIPVAVAVWSLLNE